LILNCKQNKEAEIIPVDLVDSQSQNDTKQANKLSYATASFTIKGMSCEMGCARAIENKLSSLDGISKASINFKEEMATVKFDANKIDEPLLISTVTSLSQTSSYSVEDFKMILETSKN
jgi:Cu+-exporting ATPase|tara:strand:+ start:387 stop:743 length:357 start_codon:yes stop_codon:yes gene_type:complete